MLHTNVNYLLKKAIQVVKSAAESGSPTQNGQGEKLWNPGCSQEMAVMYMVGLW